MHIENRDLLCYARFDQRLAAQIARSITPVLIEEHRRAPLGAHSDALARVLNYFRRGPVPGKYGIATAGPFGPYRIVRLTGQRGRRPEPADDTLYDSMDAVYHAVFLKRLADFQAAAR